MKIVFHGHACFELDTGKGKLLFDPYLRDNPVASIGPEDVNPDYILVSHGHFDHLGEAVEIARRTQALIITTAELATKCSEEGAQAHGMHIGGCRAFDFGRVRLTPALHGAGVPGGHACGFIVVTGGYTTYFAGDTGLFGDMRLLAELESIDLALLPIGDNFTMGVIDAVLAVKMLDPKLVIPYHYNTWPLIQADPLEFKREVERQTTAKVEIVQPGGELTLEG